MLYTLDRRYVVIEAQEVALLDFSQFLETAPETLIYNPLGTQTVVKYTGTTGYTFTYTTYGPFNLEELNTWKDDNGWPFVDDIDSDEP